MKLQLLTASSLLVIHTLAVAGVTITGPGPGQKAQSTCPANDGSNSLAPNPPSLLPPPAAGSDVMNELANGDTPFPGWTFGTGAALNGTIKISTYDSKFFGAHHSGCVMKLEYVKGAGDPANLQFIQMIETSVPLGGATSPYIDPFPSDDPPGQAMPFYWTLAEMPANTTASGIKFSDSPSRKHPPTSSVTWKGKLYITSWDGKKTVKIHDGIEYGFVAGCQAAMPVAFVTSETLSTTTIGNNDTVYVTPTVVTLCTADALPVTTIPNDPALIGYRFYAQAVVFTTDPADPIQVSNALNITINGPVIPFGVGTGFSLFAYQNPLIGGAIDLRLRADPHEHEPSPGDSDGKNQE